MTVKTECVSACVCERATLLRPRPGALRAKTTCRLGKAGAEVKVRHTISND